MVLPPVETVVVILDISANSGASAELINADAASLPVACIILSYKKTFPDRPF